MRDRTQLEHVMNRNQVDGAAKEVKGAIKEGVSKVTGNTSER